MKKIFLYITLVAFGLMGTITSCSNFGDTNLDPEHMNENNMDYTLMFSGVQVQALGSDWDVWRNGIIYGATMMQHVTSIQWGSVFYTYSEGYNAAYWDALYSGNRGVIRDVVDILRNWEGDEWFANDYQLARILKAYMFHRMTDLYGDIPYSEAGHPQEGIFYPKYERQEDIYNDLLKELNEAQAAINVSAGSKLGGADLYYNGDVEKWKKFANSLILRIAMRLSKVNPARAEEWVKIAVNNGIIKNDADIAMMNRSTALVTDDSAEPYGKIYSREDAEAFFLSEFFVDMLKNTNDPRLGLIGTVVETPGIKYDQAGYQRGDANPDIQRGMPVGYDRRGGEFDLSNAPGYPGENFRSVYSTPSRYTYADPQSPTMIVTVAENMLLLAEAAYRGWLTGTSETGTAASYYEQGIRAAMRQFSFYQNGASLYNQYLTEPAIAAYLAANPFDQSRAFEMINTQYYITTFCDEYESFANWRRSGYPVLTPVNKGYPSTATNGTIPRRFTYPSSESQNNPTNYEAAVANLNNGDTMTSRVWWDVAQ